MRQHSSKNKKHRLRNKAATADKRLQETFKKDIIRNEKFHKEAAMDWSENQDWEMLEDEFGKTDSHNRWVYKSIETFADIQSKGDDDRRRWLIKSIGPIPRQEVVWKGDFALRRTLEYSKDLEHTKMLQKCLEKDLNLMKITLPVAGSYASWKEEPEIMRRAIKKLMDGDIIQDPPEKFKDKKAKLAWRAKQVERLSFYFGWIRDIYLYKAGVDRDYLRALGADKPNMVQMVNNFANPVNGTRDEDVYHLLTKMEIEKSKMFEVPLPDEYQKKLTEGAIEAEVVSDNGNHKKKVKVN